MNSIEEIWENGNQEISEDKSLNESFIRDSISKTSISITSKLPKTIWFGVAASLGSSLAFIYNISFYSNNSSILATICFLLVLSITMVVFMLVQLRIIKNMDTKEYDLHKLLQYKIKYFNTRLKFTRYSVALSIVFVTFGINLTMENGDGIFELNKILLLSIIYVFAYLIMVYLQKFTHDIYLKQLRNALYNLKEDTLTSLDNELKKHRRIVKIIGIIIGIFFIAGIFLLLLNTKV